ncbi:DUF447 domain-containing protein [Mariniblastus fucicola]|uniref:Uncharacterized protein n=1 Tax=Mariniblastus fucicola TaxID=980251 RepID=A0A5B9PE11_9BACT|nr:DUF447 domain-containing protein [Mariniblastus fucicola]QEG23435.1 hypothetical protein MFFC18_33340 [Mariniblastus fucicola]
MILEAIITTTNSDGSVNVSPMGPFVENDPADGFELRPFETSRTFANLQQRPFGVLHVTDDAMLFAKAAIGKLTETPKVRSAEHNDAAFVLEDACRWYEFEAVYFETSEPRKSIRCKVVSAGRQRDFWGFNRAKHAVLEAAILATRVDFLPIEEILRQYESLRVIVDKTGSPVEDGAMEMLEQFVK